MILYIPTGTSLNWPLPRAEIPQLPVHLIRYDRSRIEYFIIIICLFVERLKMQRRTPEFDILSSLRLGRDRSSLCDITCIFIMLNKKDALRKLGRLETLKL